MLFGGTLLGLWAFIQPLLIYYFLYGHTLIRVGQYYGEYLTSIFPMAESTLFPILIGIILIKILLSLAVVFLAFTLSEKVVAYYETGLLQIGKAKRMQPISTQKSSLKEMVMASVIDLLHPMFLISFGLTVLFFIFSHSDQGIHLWHLMRPLALGFLMFFLTRWLPWERLVGELERRNLSGFAHSFRVAVRTLKEL
jgi:hypothetical protein